MNAFRKLSQILAVALLSATIAFTGCSKEAPFQSRNGDTINSDDISGSSLSKLSDYPLTASHTFKFQNNSNGYQGGRINLSNGSAFVVGNGALTPPRGTPHGQDVTITVEIEVIQHSRKDREMIVTFQPSGCQFGPNAELWLDWHDLGSKNAGLFLIEDDNSRTPVNPDKYDKRGKKILRLIPHFSRYALVHG